MWSEETTIELFGINLTHHGFEEEKCWLWPQENHPYSQAWRWKYAFGAVSLLKVNAGFAELKGQWEKRCIVITWMRTSFPHLEYWRWVVDESSSTYKISRGSNNYFFPLCIRYYAIYSIVYVGCCFSYNMPCICVTKMHQYSYCNIFYSLLLAVWSHCVCIHRHCMFAAFLPHVLGMHQNWLLWLSGSILW